MNFGSIGILGDSYSTFEGYIPQGNAVYYTPDSPSENGVDTPQKTWWGCLLAMGAGTLKLNDSFSGSAICNTAYGQGYEPVSSFIGRMRRSFSTPGVIDTLFVFGGTNDTWIPAPLGTLPQGVDFTVSEEDLRCVLPAAAFMFQYLREHLGAHTRIVTLVNTELDTQIAQALCTLSARFGCDCVVLHDIDKVSGHPTAAGMKQICDQIIQFYD